MLSEQQIIELAEGYVCPLGKRPTTPYEINEAKRYAEFARIVLRIQADKDAPPICSECGFAHFPGQNTCCDK